MAKSMCLVLLWRYVFRTENISISCMNNIFLFIFNSLAKESMHCYSWKTIAVLLFAHLSIGFELKLGVASTFCVKHSHIFTLALSLFIVEILPYMHKHGTFLLRNSILIYIHNIIVRTEALLGEWMPMVNDVYTIHLNYRFHVNAIENVTERRGATQKSAQTNSG